jgi:hypothetical protein
MDATTTGGRRSNEDTTGMATAHEGDASTRRSNDDGVPTPRATRGSSFTAPILTQLTILSPYKHYKHRVHARVDAILLKNLKRL